jgi:AcrR family transcriptional regulator
MSPRSADPQTRVQLIEVAAKLLAEGGPTALTTRRLATEVGTSTMAVYTHFEGMDELRHAVRQEGFDRLAQHLSRVTETEDPVADMAALGSAYFLNALTNPHLYRFMFIEPPIDREPMAGISTFETLVAAIARVIASGRFSEGDPWKLATQMWAGLHGVVTLHLAGLFTFEDAVQSSFDLSLNLCISFGDDREAAERSMTEGSNRLVAPAVT